MTSVEIRRQLVEALRLDLIGPGGGLGKSDEILPQSPSRWYLTGFLVPLEAEETQRAEPAANDEMDEVGDSKGLDDAVVPDTPAARQAYLPSSMGVSVLVGKATKSLRVVVRWGDYHLTRGGDGRSGPPEWRRTGYEQLLDLDLPEASTAPQEKTVPASSGLKVALSVRPVQSEGREGELPKGSRSVSVFLVNRRKPAPDETRDEAFAFQTELEINSHEPLVARPNLRSLESGDWDERVADLQYRDAWEFAVGHSVATDAVVDERGECHTVRTCWVPAAQVERVAPAPMSGVELSMDAIAGLTDGADAKAKLSGFVSQYRDWIRQQEQKMPQSPARRREMAEELLKRAVQAAGRIEQGIALLADPQCLDAFRIANRAMAAAARRRECIRQQKDPVTVDPPAWRPFQLAFILMNLPGIAEPTNADRGVVDLLFFPTGGGKTEAYLGLAAFTLVLRRLRNQGIGSAGLSVLMRYTLRLLTLDQLGRAATLICALEMERQKDVDKLDDWPFEIGLWVGKAATPNLMGQKGESSEGTARQRTRAFQSGLSNASPIPLEVCPWCGERFTKNSFRLEPNPDYPTDLRVLCMNRRCDFSRGQFLP
ncbi:MAG: helicase, partial [Tepidisphaeraceae bacterium]